MFIVVVFPLQYVHEAVLLEYPVEVGYPVAVVVSVEEVGSRRLVDGGLDALFPVHTRARRNCPFSYVGHCLYWTYGLSFHLGVEIEPEHIEVDVFFAWFLLVFFRKKNFFFTNIYVGFFLNYIIYR